MTSDVKFPNWQSRLLLGTVSRKQPILEAQLRPGVKALLKWYEKAVLHVNIDEFSVDRPIFLLGMPRSGTTMLQDIICAHPQVAYINNTMNRFPSVFCAVNDLRRRLRLDFESERYLADSVPVSASSPSDAVAFWGKWFRQDPFFIEHRALRMEDFSPELRAEMDETLRRVLWCYGDPSRRFFNKLLMLMPYIELVRDLFQDAKFVWIVRDPRSAANSMVKLCRLEMEHQKKIRSYRADPVYGDQYFIPYPRFPRLAEYVREYGVLDLRTSANLWNDAISFVDEVRASFPCFLEIRYEDILDQPEQELMRVLEFCELSRAVPKESAFWDKLNRVGSIRHRRAYGHFDLIEGICRDNMRKHGYAA